MHEKTFTIGEAKAALPRVRQALLVLREERDALVALHPHIDKARANAEQNGGSPFGELYLDHAFTFATSLDEIEQTGVIIKDFSVGLVDFPYEYEGRIVYLCWKLGEDDLGWWHEVEDGYAGRKPLGAICEKSH